jgi:hypothetical protein
MGARDVVFASGERYAEALTRQVRLQERIEQASW